ncbi:hypothetical protein FB451DRAFT_1367056 [Mycena latifolia]|nr:hypothetical protein FB451DRAFT_1367056 [Mycena latifolia]
MARGRCDGGELLYCIIMTVTLVGCEARHHGRDLQREQFYIKLAGNQFLRQDGRGHHGGHIKSGRRGSVQSVIIFVEKMWWPLAISVSNDFPVQYVIIVMESDNTVELTPQVGGMERDGSIDG